MKPLIKRNLSIVILALIVFISPEKTARSSSGQDRCFIDSCLCEVAPYKPTDSSFIKNTSSSHSVFFEENSHEISSSEESRLKKFLYENADSGKKASIIGYADGCGPKPYNLKLSEDRAKAVNDFVIPYAESFIIKQKYFGEASNHHHAFERRVDIIIHKNKEFITRVEKMPSDFYLIDASGSMWSDHKKWSDIVSASVKPNSRIFLSITKACKNGSSIRSVSPQGGTEIWWSYWNIIDKMKPGQTLLIISDFQSRVPLSAKERSWFQEKVIKSGVIVRSISL